MGLSGDPCFRLLYLENDPWIRDDLESGLNRYGFDVVTASHGVDGLMQFKAHGGEFDAVICSTGLPGVDGLAFLENIRQMGYLGPIVITATKLQKFESLAITGFFRKPFDVGLLATMLLNANV
jgi:DNA-binding response OmpR family regulator